MPNQFSGSDGGISTTMRIINQIKRVWYILNISGSF